MTWEQRKQIEGFIAGWIFAAFPNHETRPPHIQERMQEALAITSPVEAEMQFLEKIASNMSPENEQRFRVLIAEDARKRKYDRTQD